MEEFIQGISRLELLKRGALGAAARRRRRRARPRGAVRGRREAVSARSRAASSSSGSARSFEDINVLTAFGYRWGQLMAYAMYDTLVKYDKNGKAVPLLARELDDARTRRRRSSRSGKGVKFHNGKPDAGRGRRLEPQPHPRPGQARLEQLPRPAEGHLGQGGQDRQPDPQDHDQEAGADGRELALLVHHAGERRRPEPRRAADRHRALPVQELRQGRPARAHAVRRLLERQPAVPERADVPLPRRRGGRRSRTSSRATSTISTTSPSRRCRRWRASGTPS